jgi:hypothetical protein
MIYFICALVCVSTLAAWTDDANLRARAQDNRVYTPLPKFTVNLDAPAKDRWTEIGTLYKDQAPALIAYLETMIPAWTLPIIEAIAADIEPYFKEYGDEMIGLADAMGLKIGDVVTMNLIYQLEHIGLNCSNWNNTGPTVPDDPGCIAVDPKQEWCYCHDASVLDDQNILWKKPREDIPGLCTSVVAADSTDQVWHGRNLDWNLPDVLLEMAIDVDYQRNNKTVFIGSTIVGFVGVLNGMTYSDAGAWSGSINARMKGGKIIENLLEALLFENSMTPSQFLRYTMEHVPTYDAAIPALTNSHLVNEVYYTIAGGLPKQGVVISRDRNNLPVLKPADEYTIDVSDAQGWFRLQTNYDHWNPPPVADDRRTPGIASMNAMTRARLSEANLFNEVLTVWPVYNHHTDFTGVFNPATARYHTGVWLSPKH